MECIHQILCNLFHGEKGLKDPRDEALVRAAYAILFPHMDNVLRKEDVDSNSKC